jgi:hypothetical protein
MNRVRERHIAVGMLGIWVLRGLLIQIFDVWVSVHPREGTFTFGK